MQLKGNNAEVMGDLNELIVGRMANNHMTVIKMDEALLKEWTII